MTKQLRELYGFGEPETDITQTTEIQPDLSEEILIGEKTNSSTITLEQAYANMEKIDQALPTVKGLDSSDQELDDLAQLATEAFHSMNDLGLQVDSRSASEIFNVASSMLGHAITAKTAKINKKLKMLDLMLKKATLDQKILSQQKPTESEEENSDVKLSFDRNELLKNILSNKK